MALPVLDGNQTATTLSSVVTGGEHIVAHSVVCLGSTAIANITNAVSGSVVSISNFPSTQTIAGTVTANFVTNPSYEDSGGTRALLTQVGGFDSINGRTNPIRVDEDGEALWVKVTNEISGTVTANSILVLEQPVYEHTGTGADRCILIGTANADGGQVLHTSPDNPMPISGSISGTVTVGNSVTIGSLPAISGTVTAAAPNGSLTTRFGTPTTANVSFATSAVTNANRKYLLIQNVTTGSNVITVGIGFTPTTTQGIQLTAGAGITFESSYIPTGAVQILSSVTASNFTILEA